MKLILNVALYILSLSVSLVPGKYVWTGEKWEWRESTDNEIGDIERAPREFDGSGNGQGNLIHDEEDSIQSSLFLPDLLNENSEGQISDDEDFNQETEKEPPREQFEENENLIVDNPKIERTWEKMSLHNSDDEIMFNSSENMGDKTDKNTSGLEANGTNRCSSPKTSLSIFAVVFSLKALIVIY